MTKEACSGSWTHSAHTAANFRLLSETASANMLKTMKREHQKYTREGILINDEETWRILPQYQYDNN